MHTRTHRSGRRSATCIGMPRPCSIGSSRLRPVMEQAEGDAVQVPAGSDAGRVRLVGNVTGQPPFKGTLRHAGWEASKVQLPEWSGTEPSARMIAPAEVEI